MGLAEQRCEACESGEPLDLEQATALACETPEWTLKPNAIERTIKFGNFREAMAFVNRIADLAEMQGHHPDLHISYNKVRIELSTHKIGGLSKNDFILAAKIDQII
jgi:4a-hydroxytetrahydrobiopterin dehydratase